MITGQETALEYIQKMHEHFKQTGSYTTPEGIVDNVCWQIADELTFGLFYQEDKKPTIQYAIDESKTPEKRRIRKPFSPLLLPQTTFWGHEFCECDGFAYDPLNPEPVLLEDYSKITFNRGIPIKLKVPVWKIPIHLRRGRY